MYDYYERLLIKTIKIKAFIWRLTYHETKTSTITVEKNLPTMDLPNNIKILLIKWFAASTFEAKKNNNWNELITINKYNLAQNK